MPTPSAIMLTQEKALEGRLTSASVQTYKQLIKATRRIIGSPDPERELQSLSIIGEQKYADGLFDSMVETFFISISKTEANIAMRRGKASRTLAVQELTSTQKASASRYVGDKYSEYVDTLSAQKYADTLRQSKDVIRRGITDGWGMQPTFGYRFADGSIATAKDKQTYGSKVTREQTSPGLAEELGKVVKTNSNPSMVARTEITRAFNDGVVQGGKDDQFVKGYEFLGVNDERQSDICNFLNGTVIDKLDPRLSSITPPMHPNCRSRLVEIMVTSKKEANIDTRTIDVDGTQKRVADLDTAFGKAGKGNKAFNTPEAKQQRQDLGIPEKGLVIRTADKVRGDFISGREDPNLVSLSSGIGIKRALPKGVEEPVKTEPEQIEEDVLTKSETIDNINHLLSLVDKAGTITELSPEIQSILDKISIISK